MSVMPPWPDGQSGAVSLTFDDGLASQLQIALPMLEERDLRATFYLCPRGADWERRLQPWAQAARRGHEIGNHTLSHTCSRVFREQLEGPCLERMTLVDLEADILEAERRLRAVIPGGPRSFCYPCHQTDIGEGATRQSYIPLVARHFIAARTRGSHAWNHPLTCDLHALWGQPCERASGAQLIGLVESGADQGRWTIVTFHGVHQGHLSVADVDLRALIEHLDRHRQRLWTAPVATVAERIVAWRRAIAKLDPAERNAEG